MKGLGIKEQIASVVSSHPDRLAVRALVDQSYRFAFAYLRQKARRGRVRADLFGLSLEDLALDCFADLFQRSDDGRFEQIATYFESLGWEKLRDEELYMALRRLVFSKVNDGLFQRYRGIDASLAKIIRNIKNAVKANPDLSLVRHKRELWLIAGAEGTALTPQPTAPNEILEAFLASQLSGSDELRAVVGTLTHFTENHSFYANGYPLTAFAQALRAAYVCVGEASVPEEETGFPAYEVQQAIYFTTRSVKNDMHSSYVAKGKVNAPVFEAYFSAVCDILNAQFISDAPPVESYFDALRSYMPGLSKLYYRQEHRYRLEYLAKLSRGRLLHYLKDEPQFSSPSVSA